MLQPKILTLVVTCLFFFSCAQQNGVASDKEPNHKHTNALIDETSPYLLQHAHNPVNWYPWGEAAFAKADAEGKMVIISIGYAACHWCHVMEHESFEDDSVAKYMNEHFICIKVDREERPDVDQIYMDAAYLTNGSGGWPLNAIALPDGRPIFAGTYYPRDSWLQILNYFATLSIEDPNVLAQAEKMKNGIQSSEYVPKNLEEVLFKQRNIDNVYNLLLNDIDFIKGGRTSAPKFPMPSIWEFLLNYEHETGKAQALKAVNITLEKMAKGGIYDHIGGGFARYATDDKWQIPHFEKMMYDNGQLVSLYAHAYQKTGKPLYAEVVRETLTWIEREMTTDEGAFYASLDADSDGEEGKFYVWTKHDIDSLLGNQAPLFNEYYNITEKGNWEHGNNIVWVTKTDERVAKKFDITVEDMHKQLKASRDILLEARAPRIRPGLDDKILTSWNALMLIGYVDAYKALGNKAYLEAALNNANYLLDNVINIETGEVYRNSKGKASIPAFLDDYGLVIQAFIELYQVTFDFKWLQRAKILTNHTVNRFYDEQTGMFFYTQNNYNRGLIARKSEVADNVIPSSNSIMALNLFKLGTYFYNQEYLAMSNQMLKNVVKQFDTQAYFFTNWAILLNYKVHPPYEVAILGDDCLTIAAELGTKFYPNVLFLGGKSEGSLELLTNKLVEGQTTIYVCKNKTCKLPVTTVGKALPLIQ